MAAHAEQTNVVFSIPEALEALRGLIDQTPTVAIVGTLTAFKPGRRWASGEIATQGAGGDVVAQLRLSYPPAAVPPRGKLQVGNTVRVVGRFVVDSRYGPVQFRVAHTTILEDRAAAAEAVERLAVSIRAEGLHEVQKRLVLPTNAQSLFVICPVNRGAGGNDIIDRLDASPFEWNLEVAEVPMGVPNAGDLMASVVTSASVRSTADAIVICRGGGSPAELAPFDSEALAKAIVEATRPVVVAVGHSDDRHIADLVAHHSSPTPSAAADWFIRRRDTQRRQAEHDASRRRLADADIAREGARELLERAKGERVRARVLLGIAIVIAIVLVLGLA